MKIELLKYWEKYSSYGWELVPINLKLNSNGKKKLVEPLPWKNKNYTLDEFSNYLNQGYTGIAVKTGKTSGIFVVDVDKLNVFKKYNIDISILNNIRISKSQSGNIHLFFKWEKWMNNTKTTKANTDVGLDTRGSGGLIFLPPSKVENGGKYEWANNNDITTIPDEIKKMIQNVYDFEENVDITENISNNSIPDDIPDDIMDSLMDYDPTDFEEIGRYRIEGEDIDWKSIKQEFHNNIDTTDDRSSLEYKLVINGLKCGIPKWEIEKMFIDHPSSKASERDDDYIENLFKNAGKEILKQKKNSKKSIKQKVTLNRRNGRAVEEIIPDILDYLNKTGELFKTNIGGKYFFDYENHTLFPIYNNPKNSSNFNNFIGYKTSLFTISQRYRKVYERIVEYTEYETPTHKVYETVYYDYKSNTHYLSNFNNRIYKTCINEFGEVKTNLEYNGIDGVFFVDNNSVNEPFLIDLDEEVDKKLLDELIYDRLNPDNNGSILSVEQQKILINKWVDGLFFPELINDKPILFAFGVKGSGKTSFLSNIGLFWFGDNWNVDTIPEKVNDLQTLLQNNHFIVLDNADYTSKQIRDTLAVSSTGGVVTKRKLYTDNQEIQQNISCFISITARNSKLLKRTDLADRCLVIKTERIKFKGSTSKHRQNIKDNRNKLWNIIIKRIQRMIKRLEDTRYKHTKLKLRLADFGNFCLNTEDENQRESLSNSFEKMSMEQNDLLVANDEVYNTIIDYMKDNNKSKIKLKTAEWFETLQKYNNELPIQNSISFGRYLSKNSEIYKDMFKEYKITKGPKNTKLLCIEIDFPS